mgnify:CR=1 FL=1
MAPSKGIPLLDAATLLVGWSNRSASRGHDKVFVSGEVVQLSTKLDASNRFSLIAAHPGHSQAVTVLLEVAPQLRDGRMGTFVGVASVAIPAPKVRAISVSRTKPRIRESIVIELTAANDLSRFIEGMCACR